MRGRIVAAQRHAQAEQANRQRQEVGAEDQQREECAEEDHLGDEHPLAAEIIRQPPQQHGADQDTEQAGGADNALFGCADVELAHDQGQGDAGHEDDVAFEELAGGGERPRCAIASRSSAPTSGWYRPARPAARRYTPAPIWCRLARAVRPPRHRSSDSSPADALVGALQAQPASPSGRRRVGCG